MGMLERVTDAITGKSAKESEAERRQRAVVPEADEHTPTNANPAEQDAQQRRAEKSQKLQEVERELEAAKDRAKAEEFREMKRRNELPEEKRKAEDAAKQPKKLPTFGQVAAGVAKKKLLDPALAVRQNNIDAANKPPSKERPLTRSDVQKMIAQKQTGKKKPAMAGGQFHSPHYGGGFASPMSGVDPFAGLSKGGGMHNLGFGKMQPHLPTPPKPKPTRAPPGFGDPFKGLTSGPAPSPKIVGNKYGLGSGGKSSKKLKNIRDWMKF